MTTVSTIKGTSQPLNNTRLPLVSVIMPVYNAESYLEAAIESILYQTYTNFELIIIDDASTDDSWLIISRYQERHPYTIKAFRMIKNLGQGGDACANIGLQAASGVFVARMDADDVCHPKRLETQVAYLTSHKNVFLVGSNAYVINQRGIIIGNKMEPSAYEDIYDSYALFHPIIHSTALFRRLINGKPFIYELPYSANNDYYTFFKLISQGHRFENLTEMLLFYRIHEGNDTFMKIKEKFTNTLHSRFTVASKYGYRLTFRHLIVSIIQFLLIFGLPEPITKRIYLLSKGIIKISFPYLQALRVHEASI